MYLIQKICNVVPYFDCDQVEDRPTPTICYVKVSLGSIEFCRSIAKLENKKRELGVHVSLTEQWGYEVDRFALKFDFCVICLLNYIFTMYYDDNEKIILFYSLLNS